MCKITDHKARPGGRSRRWQCFLEKWGPKESRQRGQIARRESLPRGSMGQPPCARVPSAHTTPTNLENHSG